MSKSSPHGVSLLVSQDEGAIDFTTQFRQSKQGEGIFYHFFIEDEENELKKYLII